MDEKNPPALMSALTTEHFVRLFGPFVAIVLPSVFILGLFTASGWSTATSRGYCS